MQAYQIPGKGDLPQITMQLLQKSKSNLFREGSFQLFVLIPRSRGLAAHVVKEVENNCYKNDKDNLKDIVFFHVTSSNQLHQFD